MDKNKIMEERSTQLGIIRDELQADLIAAEIRKPEAEEPEILMAVFDEMGFLNDDGAVGEFYFQPLRTEEDEVQHFVCNITLAGHPDLTHAADLFETITCLNCYLPCGCFCMDKDLNFLMYKLITPFSIKLSGDELREEMNLCMGNAVAVTDQFADLVLAVLEGRMTAAQVKEQIVGGEQSEEEE